jgi:hypothetical protein
MPCSLWNSKPSNSVQPLELEAVEFAGHLQDGAGRVGVMGGELWIEPIGLV